MKNNVFIILVIMTLTFSSLALGEEQNSRSSDVYTIGDINYDKSFENGKPVIKLGIISADQVPPTFPKSFLEADGSYGGGVVYCSVEEAIKGLNDLLERKVLPKEMEWHIYELEATWGIGVYQLKKDDFRLKKSVKVKKRAD